ncbi:pentapeptide repeat-containing protein [Desulfurispirillum indicum]|uniref:Pentapeptide repeat protein n=1 Tax=Desulfurispirillum indicum (strain ATCC BAA-1389 / DSM 22839 / S5) TaxID=653733 RepID=E6W4A2_DESIS|nr:pentapeptide repeat-containing protein [Desulfurispirillum indicum]ADU65876.1 pentapeptide repeat protein [Desulfurispirillum indicum S5]UCZ57812.1 pentapeptide repeat-containing protein [Desulfurispirillum indicum]
MAYKYVYGALFLLLIFSLNASGRTVGNCQLRPGTQCPGENLMGANLRSANLAEGNFEGARMEAANLMHANFQGANLRGVNFQSAELRSTDFRNAALNGANFRWSRNIESAQFDGANLEEAIWVNGQVCAEGSIGQCRY